MKTAPNAQRVSARSPSVSRPAAFLCIKTVSAIRWIPAGHRHAHGRRVTGMPIGSLQPPPSRENPPVPGRSAAPGESPRAGQGRRLGRATRAGPRGTGIPALSRMRHLGLGFARARCPELFTQGAGMTSWSPSCARGAGLERLLRYCARPPLALERLYLVDDQHVIYGLPRAQRDGTTALSLTSLELIGHLAAQLVHRVATAEVAPPSLSRRSGTQLTLACRCHRLWA